MEKTVRRATARDTWMEEIVHTLIKRKAMERKQDKFECIDFGFTPYIYDHDKKTYRNPEWYST